MYQEKALCSSTFTQKIVDYNDHKRKYALPLAVTIEIRHTKNAFNQLENAVSKFSKKALNSTLTFNERMLVHARRLGSYGLNTHGE